MMLYYLRRGDGEISTKLIKSSTDRDMMLYHLRTQKRVISSIKLIINIRYGEMMLNGLV